jgi:hypothetical protein
MLYYEDTTLKYIMKISNIFLGLNTYYYRPFLIEKEISSFLRDEKKI